MKLSSITLGSISSLCLGAALALTAGPAAAGLVSQWDASWTKMAADDTVGSGGFVDPGWGGQAFDAEYLYYKWDGPVLSIGLQSGFDLTTGHVATGGKDYYAGDLALSFDGNASNYEYAVDFGLYTEDYSGKKVDATADDPSDTGIDTAGLYSVSQWNTNVAFPQSNPFAMDRGMLIRTITNISGNEIVDGDRSFYRIVSIDLSGLNLTSNVAMHWTMSCGNDVIDGITRSTVKVPEPGTLALLGSGLFGLGLVRRRRRVTHSSLHQGAAVSRPFSFSVSPIPARIVIA